MMLASVLLPLVAGSAPPKFPVALITLPQRYTNGFARTSETPFRIGTLSVANGIFASGGGPKEVSSISYAVPAGAKFFRGVIGIRSDLKASTRTRFRLLMDAKPVYEKLLKASDGGRRIAVTLNGAKVLTFQMDAAVALGDGAFTAAPAPADPAPSAVKPALLTPENGAHVMDDKLTLSWKPVPGAKSYAVEVIVTKLDSPDETIQKAFLYNVLGGGTSFTLDLTRMPPASLRWSVIAFDDGGRVGKFSEDRLIVRD